MSAVVLIILYHNNRDNNQGWWEVGAKPTCPVFVGLCFFVLFQSLSLVPPCVLLLFLKRNFIPCYGILYYKITILYAAASSCCGDDDDVTLHENHKTKICFLLHTQIPYCPVKSYIAIISLIYQDLNINHA